jgi:transcriptional regulator with XRE-family HTH domain
MYNCDNLDDLKKDILGCIHSQRELWTDKINSIMLKNGYSQSELANLCGVSRVAVAKWCKGTLPQNREVFIKIGFAAHYNLTEMNEFLMKYGRYPELYAKSLEDSVCIYLLNSKTIEHSYKKYEDILKMFSYQLKMIQNEGFNDEGDYETSDSFMSIMDMENIQDLKQFIDDNISMYRTSYKKFYSYVEAYIQLNNSNGWYDSKNAEKNKNNVYQLAESQNWTSSLRQCVYAIYHHNWFPLRRKVITLGIHLNMNLNEINDMLHMAHMETLYAKNPIECAIMYAIEDADLNDLIYCDGLDELANHVKNVLISLDIPEALAYVEDL